MEKIETIDFIDEIYKEMKKLDYAMSLFIAKIKYKNIFMKEVAEDYIKSLLLKDGRFVFINENQFFLRESIEEIMSIYDDDIDDAEEYIKDKYFVKNVHRETLLTSKYDSLNLKFGNKIYKICDMKDFNKVIKREGFITFNVANVISEHFNLDYHSLLREMDEINVRIDNEEKFKKECVVLKNKRFNRASTTIIDNKENILLIDFRTNELVASIMALYLINKGYIENHNSYFSNKHIRGLYKMNIIDEYNKNDYIKLTNIGEELIKGFSMFLDKNFYTIDYLMDKINNCKSTKELAKSKVVKKLDNANFWEAISYPIRQIYLHNEYSKLLIQLISKANKSEIYNLGDILLFHLYNGRKEEIRKIFVGETATSGLKPIKDNKDICLKCEGYKCSRKVYITKTKLLYYRCNYVDTYIKKIHKDLDYLDMIMKDLLIIKFVVPYNLTSKNKIFMKNINLLDKKSNVLHKKDGEYCPFKDIWILKEKYHDTVV
ncbi:MAG: hypothetical protein GX987_06990 [Tissierellia bacterium]|nr:hypothetical protein [Tissierellia bacterium]